MARQLTSPRTRRDGHPETSPLPESPGRGIVPPLLPVLLPLIIAAIATSVLFSWLLPPAAPEGAAPMARFQDFTNESGVDFVYRTGSTIPEESPTTLGGGVVCFDYDRDGDTDLFFVNRSPWPWEDEYADPADGRCRLYQNDGTGKFTDVSKTAGLAVELSGMSAAAGDYDNDGFPDLFVSCVGENQLFHNQGNGRFENETASAGVGGAENTWSTASAWIDVDEDGLLDLVVCHYARWLEEVGLRMAFVVANVGRSYGTPTGFAGVFPSVYRNLGDGRFTAVTGGAGLREVDPETGLPVPKAIAVVPVDANGDGRLDLLFSYHTRDNSLFVNQSDGSFRKSPITLEDRREGASTGIAASQVSLTRTSGRDERFPALVTTSRLGHESSPNEFANLGARSGVAFLDYDLDGRTDVLDGNGRAEIDTHRFEAGRQFAASPMLLWNRGNGWTPAAADDQLAEWERPVIARGVATADLDNDGDLDVVITQYGAPARLLRSEHRSDLPWLQVELEATRSARDAFGSRVEVHTPRRVHVQTLTPGSGLFAQSAKTLVFGLSEDTRVQKLVVRWPDGTRQETPVDGINRRIVLVER